MYRASYGGHGHWFPFSLLSRFSKRFSAKGCGTWLIHLYVRKQAYSRTRRFILKPYWQYEYVQQVLVSSWYAKPVKQQSLQKEVAERPGNSARLAVGKPRGNPREVVVPVERKASEEGQGASKKVAKSPVAGEPLMNQLGVCSFLRHGQTTCSLEVG